MTTEFQSSNYSVSYTLRPISDRTAFRGRPGAGDRNPFRRATWSSTQELLARELYMLRASRIVLEIDIREQDIRQDGAPRANAIARSTAVRLSFETADGPLVFATDRYGYDYYDRPKSQGWQDNVRAIALGLEALRKVDRYGITQRREQYRGFKALGAGDGTVASGMTTDIAAEILNRESGMHVDWAHAEQALRASALRSARAAAHPDRNNGDRSRWDAVDQAADVLNRAWMLS